MTDTIQSGHHPDADQISAFVEQALPVHERQQMLAHLAICPECRATVALSLPPEVEAPAPATIRSKSPWFFGWKLALPAGALVAALVLLALYLRNSPVQQGGGSTGQVAVSHPPEPPVTERAAAVPQNPSTLTKEKAATTVQRQSPASSNLRAPRMQASVQGTSQAPIVADKQLQATPSAQLFKPKDQADAKVALAAPTVAVAGARSEPPAPPSPAPVAAAESAGALALGGPQKAPMAAAPSGAVAGFAMKKLDVPAQFNLPSGLRVVSTATHLSEILAIDAGNTVFLSVDAGASWRAVPVHWNGRAVKADLVSYGRSRAINPLLTRDTAQAVFATGANSVPAPAVNLVAPIKPAQLTGTVTDASGAVIPGASVTVSSHDGQPARSAVADGGGQYRFDSLTPGVYDIRTQAPGFQQQLTQAVAVTSDKPTVSNVALSVGAASETVQVESVDNLITTTVSEPELKHKSQAAAGPPAADVFEITTDTGERWTSPDGLIWKRK